MKRELFSSGTPWEPIVGYSRAVRVGNQIWVSGTTPTDGAGHIVGKDAVSRLIDADMRVEIEADTALGSNSESKA